MLDDPLHMHSRWSMACFHRSGEVFTLCPAEGSTHSYHIHDLATYLRDLLVRSEEVKPQAIRDPMSRKILTLVELARFYYHCQRVDRSRGGAFHVPRKALEPRPPLLDAKFERLLLRLLASKFTKHRFVNETLNPPRYLVDFVESHGYQHKLVATLVRWVILQDYPRLLHAFIQVCPSLPYGTVTSVIPGYSTSHVAMDPLHLSVIHKAMECFEVLCPHVVAPPPFALHVACLTGHAKMVLRLLPYSDIHAVSPYILHTTQRRFQAQWTPLQCAMMGTRQHQIPIIANYLHQHFLRKGGNAKSFCMGVDAHESLLYLLLSNANIKLMDVLRDMWDWTLVRYYEPQSFMDASTQEAVMGLSTWARLLHVFESCAAHGVRFEWTREAHRFDIWQHALLLYCTRWSTEARGTTIQHDWGCSDPGPPIWDFLRLVALIPRVAVNTAPLELWADEDRVGVFPSGSAFSESPSRASFLAHWMHAQARTHNDRAHALFSIADELVSHSFEPRAVEGGMYAEDLWWSVHPKIDVQASPHWLASLHHLWYSTVQRLHHHHQSLQRRFSHDVQRTSAFTDVMRRFFHMTHDLGQNPHVLFATYLYNMHNLGTPLGMVASNVVHHVAQHAGVGLWQRVRTTVDVCLYNTTPVILHLPQRLESGLDTPYHPLGEAECVQRGTQDLALHCMDTCVWLGGTHRGGLLRWQITRANALDDNRALYAGISARHLGWKLLLWEVHPFTTLNFEVDRTLQRLTVTWISATGSQRDVSGTILIPHIPLSPHVRWTPTCACLGTQHAQLERELSVRLSPDTMEARTTPSTPAYDPCGFVNSISEYSETEAELPETYSLGDAEQLVITGSRVSPILEENIPLLSSAEARVRS